MSAVGDRFLSIDSSSKDKAKGAFHEAKGKIKEETGKATENRDLEDRGAAKVFGK